MPGKGNHLDEAVHSYLSRNLFKEIAREVSISINLFVKVNDAACTRQNRSSKGLDEFRTLVAEDPP